MISEGPIQIKRELIFLPILDPLVMWYFAINYNFVSEKTEKAETPETIVMRIFS